MKFHLLHALAFCSATIAAPVWDGRFSDYTNEADFDDWSWSNQVGEYETYIYGNTDGETASDWLNLGQYKTPSGNEAKTVKVKLTSESTWNSGPMLRTELIPQTTETLEGNLFFHVSLYIPSTNQPNTAIEHQIVFWESHASELKYGQLNGQTDGEPNTLRFLVSGTTEWSIEPELDTWYNFAIETGSDSGGLYESVGADDLKQVWTGNAGDGGAQFHIGMLRLNGDDMADEEDIYYAGVYVEDSLTTTVT